MTKHDCSPNNGPIPFLRAASANNTVNTMDYLAELFDNSIDAGATRIAAEIDGAKRGKGNGRFAITDNGRGVDSIRQLLVLGESGKPGGEETIGRYGIGAKDCFYTVGGITSTLVVQSVSRKAGAWSCHIPWQAQTDWLFETEENDPADFAWADGGTGLWLEINSTNRRMVPASDLVKRLSRIYWPWLLRPDHRMTVNGQVVVAPARPATDGRLRSTCVQLDGGRSLTIEGGLLAQDSELAGVTVMQGNRCVYVADAIGLGDYPRAGVFFLVKLAGPWGLGRNKIGMIEEHHEELDNELEKVLSPIMRDAQAKLLEIDSSNLLDDLNEQFDVLNSVFKTGGRGGSKPGGGGGGGGGGGDRGPGGGGPGSRPGGRNSPAGGGDKRQKPFRVEFVKGEEEDSIGYTDMASRRVCLHSNNSSISKLRNEKNVQSLVIVAGSLLVHELDKKQKGKLPYPCMVGSMLNSILNGKAAELV